MSASPRPRLGGTSGYQRPAVDVLDDLTDPGNSDTRVTSDNAGSQVTEDTLGISVSSANSGNRDTAGTRGTRGTKPSAEPRDHVKLARSLADEMRDAVWFLTEHGRPRVQLGELLDEAVRGWLEGAKAEHNDGESFPARGRLR